MLDLSVWRPGPYTTRLLADLGADVIKIEPPTGDPLRSYPNLFRDLGAGKRSIAVDLKSADGRARVLELAAEADVVLEGFRPGVADRLGVGYEQVRAVNPTIVYCSVSGMGQTGPLALVPGHDVNYTAWAGVLAPDGGRAVEPAIPVADLAGGLAAAFGVCAAIIGRLRTGAGDHVDVAMADVLATWTGATPPVDDPDAPRGVPGYGVYETADGGQITLGIVSEDHFWRGACGVLGLADLAGIGFPERVARLHELQVLLATAIRRHDRDPLVTSLLAADVPAAPVLARDEMVAVEHFRVRGAVTSDPWSDPATGQPIRFTHHATERTAPPPALDEHHDATFRPR